MSDGLRASISRISPYLDHHKHKIGYDRKSGVPYETRMKGGQKQTRSMKAGSIQLKLALMRMYRFAS
jgi:hypothetical protein